MSSVRQHWECCTGFHACSGMPVTSVWQTCHERRACTPLGSIADEGEKGPRPPGRGTADLLADNRFYRLVKGDPQKAF
jgi:hypothetical protein